jgi:NADH-quinone oxidoreductase subunit A
MEARMGNIWMSPPVAFLLLLGLSVGISAISKALAARGADARHKTRAYACGEDMVENQGQPDYSEFFKFAFFFTIMHVVVLVVATDSLGLSPMSLIYLGVTVLALFMLFRR